MQKTPRRSQARVWYRKMLKIIKIKIENKSGRVAGKEKLAWVQVVQIVNARLCEHP